MIHLSIMPGGSLDRINYFLFVILITTFPYREFDVMDIPLIYYSSSLDEES